MRGNPQPLRTLAALALALVATAACTDSGGTDASGSIPTTAAGSNGEGDGPQDTTDDSSETSGPLVTSRPPTSLDGDDAEPPSQVTTTSTSDPSTTTTEAPPAAQGVSLLLVGYGTAGGWNGSDWDQGDWYESPGRLPTFVGQNLTIISIDGAIGQATATEPSDVCGIFGSYGLNTQPRLSDIGGFPHIGVISAWDPAPQSWEEIHPRPEVYLEELQRILQTEGLDPSLASVDQAIRVDLEGDGVDEVFLVSNDAWDFTIAPTADSHSLTLMRRVVNEEVQTARLFFTRQPAGEPESFFFLRSRIAGFADLNGDGKLEIITQEEYYEGSSIIAWEYLNDDIGPVEVLATGCGV